MYFWLSRGYSLAVLLGCPNMPLIIESYFNPESRISSLLFPGKQFTFVDRPLCDPDGYYYTREEIARPIKYYFSKIYYVEGDRIVCLDKAARLIKHYYLDTGKQIVLKRTVTKEIDKTGFLPQLDAQEGDVVLFPEEEDEEL